jgi:hypothetical protein
MEGYCLLCNRRAELQLSHILPAFAFRWQRRSGGHIRHSASINRRVQDGAKERWLCSECEALFNGWETKFSNIVFHRTNIDGLPSVSYGEWLLKFCTSISWRSLLYLRQQTQLGTFTPKQLRLADEAQETWAKFLRGELPHPGVFEQHLVPFGAVSSESGSKFPPNINRYLLRTIEINFGRGPSTMFVYSKVGRFAILGFVQMDYPKQWIGSKVRLRGGVLKPREYVFPVQFGDFLADRAARVWEILDDMSGPQQRQVNETIRSNLDRFTNSDLFKAIQLDVGLFGRAAFRK